MAVFAKQHIANEQEKGFIDNKKFVKILFEFCFSLLLLILRS